MKTISMNDVLRAYESVSEGNEPPLVIARNGRALWVNDVRQTPTILTPWFVVYRERPDGKTEYFRDEMDVKDFYTQIKGLARMFNNIRDAARVALAEKAMIRVLVTREDAEEFGHAGA